MHVCLLPWLSFYAHLLLSSILVWLFGVLVFSLHLLTVTHVFVSSMHVQCCLFWSSVVSLAYLYVWLLLQVFGCCCGFVVQRAEFSVFNLFLFSSFFWRLFWWCWFGVCKRMFEVIYNGHGLCMFVCYLFYDRPVVWCYFLYVFRQDQQNRVIAEVSFREYYFPIEVTLNGHAWNVFWLIVIFGGYLAWLLNLCLFWLLFIQGQRSCIIVIGNILFGALNFSLYLCMLAYCLFF